MRQRHLNHPRSSTAALAALVLAAVVPVVASAPAAYAETDGEARPDLVVSLLPSDPPGIGEVRRDTVTITNNGDAPAEHVVFRTRLTRGLDFPERAPGCSYSTDADQVRQALCILDDTIEPGATVTVPVPYKTLPKALMETIRYGTSTTGAAPGDGIDEAQHELRLTADSSADLAAAGDSVRGAPGDTVTATASLRNDGPGWVRDNESDDQPALMVTIPAGTEAVEVPEECAPFGTDGPAGPSEPGHPRYVCWPADQTLEVGSVHTYAFELKIKDGAKDSTGEARATSVYDIHPAFDRNAANDTAAITLDVRGGGSGDGPGGGGNTDDDGPGGTGAAGSGGQGPSGHDARGGNTPVTQTGVRTALAAGSGTGGGLAATGTRGLPLAAASALAAALAGGLLVIAGRRHRRGTAS